MDVAFPYLLRPHLLSARNRARRRERGDLSRGCSSVSSASSSAGRCSRARRGSPGSWRITRSSATICSGSACRGCFSRSSRFSPSAASSPRCRRSFSRTICDCCSRRRFRSGACSTPAFCGRWPGVVDGRDLSRAGAARHRLRALREPDVLRHGAADGRPVFRDPGRVGHGRRRSSS